MCQNMLLESIDASTVMATLLVVRGRDTCRQLEELPPLLRVTLPHKMVLRRTRAPMLYGLALHACLDRDDELN
jgi:hypothetical protein